VRRIPPEDIPHLYEPLEVKLQLNTMDTVGLPLAMKIIRMHEGELQVQSEENKGTIVTIVFKKATLKKF
jgi:K+-sensing histidine kinase KdpD